MGECKILYVDDERANRVIFDKSFGRTFDVIVVDSGDAALETLEREPSIGVIVTDQRMPGMSGNELLTHVKESHPDVIRIIVTAYSDLDPILRALNAGLVARYVVKPWDRQELTDILTWATQAFRLGRDTSSLQMRILRSERLLTLGSISAAVLHDMRQPISYVTANAERLREFAEPVAELRSLIARHGEELSPSAKTQLTDLAEELPEIAQDMEEGCRLMLSLSDSVRRMSRPLSLEPESPSTEPASAVRYAMSMCQGDAARGRCRLSHSGTEDLPPIRMNWASLAQVLINVLMNAIQAVAAKESDWGTVSMHAFAESDSVSFVIRDNGIGMSDETLSRYGVPFHTTRTDGLGLGSSQCRRLVEGAGGTVKVTSQEGVSTEVTLEIPRV